MKKVLVGLTALLVATGAGLASDCTSNGKKCGCKPKKYRVIYVTAHNPETMYDNSMFEAQEIGPDYRMVPMERSAAMHDRRTSFAEDEKYYDNYSEAYDDQFDDEPTPVARTHSDMAGGYIGGRVGIDLVSWKNRYKATPITAAADLGSDHDEYFMQPVFGGDVFVGLHLNPAVRLDLEAGYISQFEDSDNEFTFKLSAPYTTLNAYYDFINGFYLGVGAGMAFPKATMDWAHFVAGSGTERQTSFMAAIMGGWTHYLSDRVVLDLRARIAGFEGPKWTRGVTGYGTLESIQIKTGYIVDTSFKVGLRFEF